MWSTGKEILRECKSAPLVSMGVDCSPCCPRMRPVRWVMNCELAAYLSCRSQLISIILHRSISHMDRNFSALIDARAILAYEFIRVGSLTVDMGRD